MIDVIFRGKDLTGVMNHSWFEGSLDLTFNPEFPVIICKDRYDNIIRVIVDKQTVGQYVGQRDKNKTKIFEGDILEFDFEDIGKQRAFVYYDVKYHSFLLKVITSDFQYVNIEEGVIIGNVHDNPELLKVYRVWKSKT